MPRIKNKNAKIDGVNEFIVENFYLYQNKRDLYLEYIDWADEDWDIASPQLFYKILSEDTYSDFVIDNFISECNLSGQYLCKDLLELYKDFSGLDVSIQYFGKCLSKYSVEKTRTGKGWLYLL